MGYEDESFSTPPIFFPSWPLFRRSCFILTPRFGVALEEGKEEYKSGGEFI